MYVAWKRGLPRKFARFVLFRLIKKRSFQLECVLDLYYQYSKITLFFNPSFDSSLQREVTWYLDF